MTPRFIRPTAAALAAAAFAAFGGAAQAQTSSNQIYGILDASVSYSSADNSKVAMRSGDLAAARLGFKGTEVLGNGLKANFALEAGLNHDSGMGSATNTNNQASGTTGGTFAFNRQSWVGVEGSWGEVRLGRNFNPTYRQYIAYDPFMGGGIGASQAAQSSLATYGHSPSGLRNSNAVEYWLPSKGNLTGQFMYAMGENVTGQANSGDGDYLGGRVAYQLGATNFGLGYAKFKVAAKGDVEELIAGARTKVAGADVMAMLTHTRTGIGQRQDGWLLGTSLRQNAMQYRVSLSGSNLKAAGGNGIGRTTKLAAVAQYHLSKRSSVYLMGVFNKNSDGAAMAPLGTLNAAETGLNRNARVVSVGMTHVF